MSVWLPKIKRALSLAAVWLVAGYCAWMAYGAFREHEQRTAELGRMRADYESQADGYAKLLAEGEKIQGDKQYQKDLLKKRFGYTEPDETPIVIVRDNQDSHEQAPGEHTPADPPPADEQ